jgi:hypothetical protein
MTAVTLYDASFDDGNVTMHITLDDQSLVVQQLIYHNATTQPGALLITAGQQSHSIACPANSDQTRDLTSLNVVCTKRSGVGRFGPYVVYDLPNGEQVSFQWPA